MHPKRTLLPLDVAATIPATYTTENTPADEKKAVVKFFNPCGAQTWWVFEASAVLPDGTEKALAALRPGEQVEDITMFAYVTGTPYHEFGYVSLRELESVRGPLGLGIERDLYYTPQSLTEIRLREG